MMKYDDQPADVKGRKLRGYLETIYGGDIEEFNESLQRTIEAPGTGETLGPFRQSGSTTETLELVVKRRFSDIESTAALDTMEAVIHSQTGERPAFMIINDSFESPHGKWAALGRGSTKTRLENSIPSIGRVELPDDWRRPYGGTAFIVGDGLLMTNRHVAKLFANGWGNRTLIFQRSEIDFRRELPSRGAPAPTAFEVEKVLMIHPYWDMAILKVRNASQDGMPLPAPIALSVAAPEQYFGQKVAIIGYPGFDTRGNVGLQNRIFQKYGFKRLQPGILRGRADYQTNSERSVEYPVDNALDHDCSTLGGNSGSAVLLVDPLDASLDAAPIVGLHFAGDYLERNYAVPVHAMAMDSRIVDTGINFVGELPPSGAFYPPIWNRADQLAIVNMPEVAGSNIDAPAVDVANEGLWGAVATPSPRNNRFDRSSLLDARFSWKAAISAALASNLSYLRDPHQLETIGTNQWGFNTCKLLQQDGIECFVAIDDHLALVSFRGTEQNIGDWLTDLNVFSRTRPYGVVHRGFHSGFQSIRGLIETELSVINGKPVVLTGHSLGGALAMIAAAEWGFTDSHQISHLYTYGQPAVGKGPFDAFMKHHFDQRIIRIVNDDDIVARVPPTYQHVGRLLHLLPFSNSESLQPVETTSSNEMLTADQFDRLRSHFLQVRIDRESGVAPPAEEGFFPSFRDHALDHYIERLIQELPTNSASSFYGGTL